MLFIFLIADSNAVLNNQEKFVCDGPSDISPGSDDTSKCWPTNGTNLFQVDSGER